MVSVHVSASALLARLRYQLASPDRVRYGFLCALDTGLLLDPFALRVTNSYRVATIVGFVGRVHQITMRVVIRGLLLCETRPTNTALRPELVDWFDRLTFTALLPVWSVRISHLSPCPSLVARR
jgi:hypothetical protein